MSYLKDREIWLSKVPTGNPPAGFFWKFIQNGKVVVRDSSGNDQIMVATSGSQAITGSLTVTEGITGTVSSASYVEYSNVANKPALVSGSEQITYSGLTGIPSGIVSGSAQIADFGIFATTGSNGFNGDQSITGSLTVTGQVVAQTLNVQQVTSSVVYSSGSNVFGNELSNTQQFTGSLQVTGSLTVAGAGTFSSSVTSDDLILTAGTLFGAGNTGFSNRLSDTTLYLQMPASGFNITDNALNTRFLLASTGAATFQTTGNNGIINIGGSTYYSQLETNSTLGGLKIKSIWGAANSGIIQFINGTSENIRMHIADNGNVDVGLTNATDRLTISRNVADNAGGITLYNADTSGYGSALTFRVNYAGVYNTSRIHGDWGTGNSGLLHFFTANTSQTLVERMLIDGSGNVGINTDSPGSLLSIKRGASGDNMELIGSGASGYSDILFYNTNKAARLGYIDWSDTQVRWNVEANIPLALYTNATERMQITSTGNVIVGYNQTTTTTIGRTFATAHASANRGATLFYGINDGSNGGMLIYNVAAAVGALNSQYITFETHEGGIRGGEVMRITTLGYLKASNTGAYANAAGTYHELNNNVSFTAALAVRNTHASSPSGQDILFTSSPNNTSSAFLYCADGTEGKFIVFSNGDVDSRTNSYGGWSDIKLKENIQDASPKLDDLMKVKVKNYNFIGDDKKQLGVIAQELEEIFPALVSESPDFENRNVPQLDENGDEFLDENGEVVMMTEKIDLGTTTKSVKYSVFVPMLIKALQEQQTLIESLKSRIEILEQ